MQQGKQKILQKERYIVDSLFVLYHASGNVLFLQYPLELTFIPGHTPIKTTFPVFSLCFKKFPCVFQPQNITFIPLQLPTEITTNIIL